MKRSRECARVSDSREGGGKGPQLSIAVRLSGLSDAKSSDVVRFGPALPGRSRRLVAPFFVPVMKREEVTKNRGDVDRRDQKDWREINCRCADERERGNE